MNRLARLFIPVSVLTWLCVRYLDRPVAVFVQKRLYASDLWTILTGALPDTLLTVVVVVSSAACIGYFYRKWRLQLDSLTDFLQHVALSLPVAYMVRWGLKFAFGRVVVRAWLHAHKTYEFRWFHGIDRYNGFPSGHMLVFATLVAAIIRYFPSSRPYCYGLLCLLALLLVATNYHFVADVVSGCYAGFLVEACVHALRCGESGKSTVVS